MAKKKRSPASSGRSYMTARDFYLHPHDEDKLLLFATGLILGIGISATIMGVFIYGGVVLVVTALVLLYIEYRQMTIHNRKS